MSKTTGRGSLRHPPAKSQSLAEVSAELDLLWEKIQQTPRWRVFERQRLQEKFRIKKSSEDWMIRVQAHQQRKMSKASLLDNFGATSVSDIVGASLYPAFAHGSTMTEAFRRSVKRAI